MVTRVLPILILIITTINYKRKFGNLKREELCWEIIIQYNVKTGMKINH